MKTISAFAAFVLSLYLGIHNGKLALWQSGETRPLKVYPYSASVYTKIDQYNLNNGIKISTNTEITKLLDDFLS